VPASQGPVPLVPGLAVPVALPLVAPLQVVVPAVRPLAPEPGPALVLVAEQAWVPGLASAQGREPVQVPGPQPSAAPPWGPRPCART